MHGTSHIERVAQRGVAGVPMAPTQLVSRREVGAVVDGRRADELRQSFGPFCMNLMRVSVKVLAPVELRVAYWLGVYSLKVGRPNVNFRSLAQLSGEDLGRRPFMGLGANDLSPAINALAGLGIVLVDESVVLEPGWRRTIWSPVTDVALWHGVPANGWYGAAAEVAAQGEYVAGLGQWPTQSLQGLQVEPDLKDALLQRDVASNREAGQRQRQRDAGLDREQREQRGQVGGVPVHRDGGERGVRSNGLNAHGSSPMAGECVGTDAHGLEPGSPMARLARVGAQWQREAQGAGGSQSNGQAARRACARGDARAACGEGARGAGRGGYSGGRNGEGAGVARCIPAAGTPRAGVPIGVRKEDLERTFERVFQVGELDRSAMEGLKRQVNGDEREFMAALRKMIGRVAYELGCMDRGYGDGLVWRNRFREGGRSTSMARAVLLEALSSDAKTTGTMAARLEDLWGQFGGSSLDASRFAKKNGDPLFNKH